MHEVIRLCDKTPWDPQHRNGHGGEFLFSSHTTYFNQFTWSAGVFYQYLDDFLKPFISSFFSLREQYVTSVKPGCATAGSA